MRIFGPEVGKCVQGYRDLHGALAYRGLIYPTIHIVHLAKRDRRRESPSSTSSAIIQPYLESDCGYYVNNSLETLKGISVCRLESCHPSGMLPAVLKIWSSDFMALELRTNWTPRNGPTSLSQTDYDTWWKCSVAHGFISANIQYRSYYLKTLCYYNWGGVVVNSKWKVDRRIEASRQIIK